MPASNTFPHTCLPLSPLYIYIYICVCMYVCMYVFMYVCMYVCMYVYMYVCMYVCMYVICMYVCEHMFLFFFQRLIDARYPDDRSCQARGDMPKMWTVYDHLLLV